MALVLLGFSAGLFAVPLNALLQQRAGREEKGQLIATNNFMNTIGIFFAAATHWTLKVPLQSVARIRSFADWAADPDRHRRHSLPVLPDYFVRFVLWLLTHTVYRIRIVGEQNYRCKARRSWCPITSPSSMRS